MKTTRDRWIMAILPGLFLFIVYQYGFSGPMAKTIAALRESAPADQAGKSTQDLNTALRDAERAEDELEAEKKVVTQNEAIFPEEWKDSDRTRTLQELSQLFEESGVLMLNSSLQRDRSIEGPLQDLAKGLKDRYGAPDPQLWRFELSGTYTKISALLKRLGSSKRFIVPLNVDMKVEDDSANLTWTVTLWI